MNRKQVNMPPAAHSYNEWMESDSRRIVVDCLLPTGIIVPLTVDRDATVEVIKEKLWKEAQDYPLFNSLRAKLSYVFQCVTSMAEKVELEDETRPLLDMKPFQPVLKVVERQGNKMEKISNLRISMLIGKGLHEFDNLKSTEVSDFREIMRSECENIAKERDNKSPLERVKFMFPLDLADEPGFPTHLSARLTDKKLTIQVRELHMKSIFTFQVSCSTKPNDLVSMVIEKRKNLTGFDMGVKDKYLLKVCGREEFLLGDYPLSQFMYIRWTVTKGSIPSVVLLEKDKLIEESLITEPVQTEMNKPPSKQTKVPTNKTILWDMNDRFSLRLKYATNTNNEDFSKMFLKACIYHGSDAMCSVETSKEVLVNQGMVAWEEDLVFDICLKDVPRMARLCFVLFNIKERRSKGDKRPNTAGGKKKQRNKDYTFPVSWVNIPLFDYSDVLRTGPCVLYMWPVSDHESLSDGEAMLNPIGTVESNPMSNGAVCLSIEFHHYNTTSPIYYPPFEQVLEVAAKHTDFLGINESLINSHADFNERMSTIMLDQSKNVSEQHLEQLRSMVEKDPLTQLYDQEKQNIWRLRYECQHHFPHSLPKLLRCVKWNYHIDVAQVQALLQIWPVLMPDQVLELLDFDYADKSVRKYAVNCLKNISDQQFSQYLLQFVQVLKYETYLECDLVHFLLERALNNRHIGHRLFWMLRSEMHVPSVSVRFGLILEAYCRGSAHHIEDLSRQTIALDKLKTLSVHIKKEKSREQYKEDLKKGLEDPKYVHALSGISSTLDPCYKLKYPRNESCKVMDSKMKPLWLVFENHDGFGDPVTLMYKNGDDLRQDMLTLQMLRIIDDIWQKAGMDLRLNAYGCLSTAHSEGLIQVVTGSNTLANIQKQYAWKIKAAFNKQSLYEYLCKYNNTEEKLQKAINEFTLSCAGYSVAMYVLGVADRHGDNILLKEDGQLFHIDFGHFLGHFKSKAGINREPAPFMLTSDFVYVIQRGPDKCHKAFDEFKSTCEKAYMVLRERCNFLMSLLLMMMNTGIPELSRVEDIEYLKKTLQPHLKEEDAKRHFNKQWTLALKNSWKVAVNNTFHNMMRDNT